MGVVKRNRRLGHGVTMDVHAGTAVDFGRNNPLPHERTPAAGVDGHAVDVGDAQHHAGLGGDLLQALVAADGGDARQLDRRVLRSQEDRDGVVVAGIAIEDDLAGPVGSAAGR